MSKQPPETMEHSSERRLASNRQATDALFAASFEELGAAMRDPARMYSSVVKYGRECRRRGIPIQRALARLKQCFRENRGWASHVTLEDRAVRWAIDAFYQGD